MIPLLLLVGLLVANTTAPYQAGYFDGTKAGLEMGKWQGAAPYAEDAYTGLGQICADFNSRLAVIFGPTDPRTKALWQLKPENPFAEDYLGWA